MTLPCDSQVVICSHWKYVGGNSINTSTFTAKLNGEIIHKETFYAQKTLHLYYNTFLDCKKGDVIELSCVANTPAPANGHEARIFMAYYDDSI